MESRLQAASALASAMAKFSSPIFKPTRLTALLFLFSFLAIVPAPAALWTTAYYPGYEQGAMPASNIDFTTLTHVIHFALTPQSNGTLDNTANSLTAANISDLVSLAHAAGRKVLVCVGGADSETGFVGATSTANLTAFVTNIVRFMSANGYDGVDLDWEPLADADVTQYQNLVTGLRASLNNFAPPKLLTAAVASQPAMFAAIQSQFDQINVMTYDMAGPYPGWVTWFNSPIYDGGYRFQSTGALIPSDDGLIGGYISSGVPPDKLGIGIAFYGYSWTGPGITGPRQSWTTSVPAFTALRYSDIITSYYQSNRYHWDTNAQAAYLSVTNSPAANDQFISYDDEHTCGAKISYARNRGLGGVMIWELSQDYFATQPAGQRAPLLQAVKSALATPGLTAIQINGQSVQLSFSSLPLALYRVEWSTNLASGTWNTLTNNVAGTGSTISVFDSISSNQSTRFYRFKTPP